MAHYPVLTEPLPPLGVAQTGETPIDDDQLELFTEEQLRSL